MTVKANSSALLAGNQADEWQLSKDHTALLNQRRKEYLEDPSTFPSFEKEDFDLMVQAAAHAYDKKAS